MRAGAAYVPHIGNEDIHLRERIRQSAARAKPRPDLYLDALERLGLRADEAIAFEDSPNGAIAAKAAGVYVVGVPNAVTRDYGLADHADLVVDSLADLPPDELLARVA